MLGRFDPEGTTEDVAFLTRKARDARRKGPRSATSSWTAADGNTWEQLLAGELRAAPRRRGLRQERPPRLNDPLRAQGPHPLLRARLPRATASLEATTFERTLIVEVSGSQKSPGPTQAKADTARNLWCTAVNNHGDFGRWGYVEITDMPTLATRLDEAIAALYADAPDHRRPRPARLPQPEERRRATRKREPDGPTPVDAIPHGDKRVNIPTADAQDFVDPRSSEIKPARATPRDPSLDPQLVWRGKDDAATEPTLAVADAPPIYIQEKIDPRVLDREPAPNRARPASRARAHPVRHLRRPRRARPRRLLPARRPTGRTA